MTSLFLSNGRNLVWLNYCRRLSSYNNNRTKFGIVSLLKNEDLNIWSESNWSELGKQFNKSIEFPLPGQTGITLNANVNNSNALNNNSTIDFIGVNKKAEKDKNGAENINFLFNKPMPFESQAIKFKEAAGGLYYKNKMENSLFNSNNDENRRKFELKAFKCPVSLVKDFQYYFKSNLINDATVTVLTISFKAENDMATWSYEVDAERELLIKKFVESAQELCTLLDKGGFWADYIDPSTGKPFKSEYTHATFYETDERYRQLGFEIIDYGCCKVINHHKWGTKTYVGSLLTNAPPENEFLTRLMRKFND